MSDRGGDHGVAEIPDGAGAAPSGQVVIDPAATPADPPDRPPAPATPPGALAQPAPAVPNPPAGHEARAAPRAPAAAEPGTPARPRPARLLRAVGLPPHRRRSRPAAPRPVHRDDRARDADRRRRRAHGVVADLAGELVPRGRLRHAGAARGQDLDPAHRLVVLPHARPVPLRPLHVRRDRRRLRDPARHPGRRDHRRRRRDRRHPAGVAARLGAVGDVVALGGRPRGSPRRRLHHGHAHRPRGDHGGAAVALAAAGAGGAVVLHHRRVPVRGHARRRRPRHRRRDRVPRRAAAVRRRTGVRAAHPPGDPHARLRRADRDRPDRARRAALPRTRAVRLRGRAGRADGRRRHRPRGHRRGGQRAAAGQAVGVVAHRRVRPAEPRRRRAGARPHLLRAARPGRADRAGQRPALDRRCSA